MKTYSLPSVLITTLVIFFIIPSCQPPDRLTPDEARAIAREAYIYGFPMVMGYKAMYAYVLDKSSPEYKGTFNHLSCDPRLLTPEDKAIVTPNSDTPYCMLWADIRNEPVVISVPEMDPERFYHFQLVDLYTHNFAYIGTLTTGNGAGNYLVAEKGWNGDLPDGIDAVIPCETPLFFVIVRTQLFGPEDLENVKNIMDGYRLRTLGEYNGGPESRRAETIAVPEWQEGDQFTPVLFSYMDALLDMVEPVPEEQEMRARFARLGIGMSSASGRQHFNDSILHAIETGVKEGQADIESFVKRLNADPLASAKIFGTREFLEKSARENYGLNEFYLLRASAARLGLYGNSAMEAIYPVYLQDGEGMPLDASKHDYAVTFPPGQLPPVKSFWSLTMYDGKTQLMVPNPLERYLLNSNMMDAFVHGKDGSLTFYLQTDPPGEKLESNWLPAPDGPFYAVLRLYGPLEAAYSGDWKNPPIIKADK